MINSLWLFCFFAVCETSLQSEKPGSQLFQESKVYYLNYNIISIFSGFLHILLFIYFFLSIIKK